MVDEKNIKNLLKKISECNSSFGKEERALIKAEMDYLKMNKEQLNVFLKRKYGK